MARGAAQMKSLPIHTDYKFQVGEVVTYPSIGRHGEAEYRKGTVIEAGKTFIRVRVKCHNTGFTECVNRHDYCNVLRVKGGVVDS